MKKKLSMAISIMVSFMTFTTSTGLRAFALPIDNEVEQQQNDNIINKLELEEGIIKDITLNNDVTSSAEFETSSNIEKIQILDNKISLSMENIKKIDDSINKVKDDIEDKEHKITEIQDSYDETKNLINNKNRVSTKINKTGLGLFEIVLKSDNFNDLFKSLELYRSIAKVQNKSLKDLNNKEEQLNVLKEDLNEKNKDLEKTQEKLKKETENLEDMKKEVLEDIKEEALNNNRQASIITPPAMDVEASETAKKIINESYKYLGIPYVWGGTTPSGFDCSGLTQYVYNKAGITIPRVAEAQQSAGTLVALNDLKPGDLVFWGNPAHHVGIYIGDGLYLHAPHTGDVVKISKLTTATNAVRYVKDYDEIKEATDLNKNIE